MNPKISVIVPIYNVEDYLHQCVDSLINQSYQNLEIILVDDESPDKCGEICDDYQLKDERIVVIHQKNQGLSGARNSGLDVATGDYIAFVDSDDWVELDMYETLIKMALTHQLDMIECGINVSGNGGIAMDRKSPSLNLEDTWQAIDRILKTTQFSVCTKLFKKAVLGKSRFLLNKTSEDIYFVIENIPKMTTMGFYQVPFYNYRQNPVSITKSPYNLSRFDDAINACLFVKDKLLTSLTDTNLDHTHRNQQELKSTIQHFVLKEFMFHYKMLNYNSNLDPKYVHRKRLKQLINNNYSKNSTNDTYVKLAKLLSVGSFEKIIMLNKLKHRFFRTNQFS